MFLELFESISIYRIAFTIPSLLNSFYNIQIACMNCTYTYNTVIYRTYIIFKYRNGITEST